jgi:HPt (histidine-containing phosphotransfer) domain-containing protein
MIDELRRRFLPRFLEGGRGRLARAESACDGGPKTLSTAASELHSLAGEAALLELGEIARIARAGEQAARAGHGDPCRGALQLLKVELDLLDEHGHRVG